MITLAQSNDQNTAQGAVREYYPNIPSIALIGVRIGKYMDLPASAKGPAIDVYIWDQCYAMEQSLRIE